jgi:hypothetical protein
LQAGHEFDANGEAEPWNLAAPVACYGSGDFPDDYQYADKLEEWGDWGNLVLAEVLYQIYEQYHVDYPQGEFFGPGQDWELHVIVLDRVGDSIGTGLTAGGSPWLFLSPDPEHVPAELAAFTSHLTTVDRNAGDTVYAGSTTALPTIPDPLEIGVHPDYHIRFFLHEFVHTLDPYDGPPNQINNPPCDRNYFYGNLNVICQHLPASVPRVPFRGTPPLADPWLALLPLNTGDDPSNPVTIDITDRSIRGARLTDVATGGQMYRYSLGAYNDDEEEYFILAFHGGGGLDGEQDEYYGPHGDWTVPSTGLAIWHCVGTSMFDLESAHGNWTYADHPEDFPVFQPHWEVASPLLIWDTETGRDNYDCWSDGAGPRVDYGPHEGFSFDFFQIDEADTNLHTPLFNWSTNPNPYGYARSGVAAVRRRPQNQPCPLIVEIKERITSGPVDTLVVDLLHAPSERILTTPPAAVSADGEVIEWTWETRWQDDVMDITQVEAWFSNNDGATYERLDGEELVYQSGGWSWDPRPEHGTEAGRMRFEFFNSLDPSRVGVFDVASAFQVTDGFLDVAEQLVAPNGGEVYAIGDTIGVRWTNHFEDAFGVQIDRVALEYSLDDGASWTAPPAWEFAAWDTVGQDNAVEIVAGEFLMSTTLRLKLVTFYEPAGGDPVINSDVSDGASAVLPLGFSFASQTVQESQLDYTGRPLAASVFDLDQDGRQDLLVAIGEDPGQTGAESKFYRSVPNALGLVRFEDLTGPEFADGPDANFDAVVAADFDGDGREDLLMGRGPRAAFYVADADGDWRDVGNDRTWFDPAAQAALTEIRCAAALDFDHDGDLDLYLGRAAQGFGGELTDRLLANQGAEAPVRFLDVTSEALPEDDGSPLIGSFDTVDVAWGDWDGDGWYELLVAGAAREVIHVEEQARGVFGQNTDPIYALDGPGRDLDLRDTDRDGAVDLVFSSGSQLFRCAPGGSPEPLLETGELIGFTSGDVDLDGYPDLLVMPQSGAPAQVALNLTQPLGVPLHLVGSRVGLSPGSGSPSTMALADFDEDGDLDVFLGHDDVSPDGRIARSRTLEGAEAFARRSVTLRLVGREDHPSAIGARVELSAATTGDPLGAQIVAATGGRSGQASRALHFGLGDDTRPVIAEIQWPLGRKQTVALPAYDPANPHAVVVIEQAVDFAIDEQSIAFTMLVGPGGVVTWRFEWTTDHWTDAALDAVVVESDPLGCLPQGAVLEVGTSGVTTHVEYAVNAATQTPFFQHRLEYEGAPCIPNCGIGFHVRSDNGMWPALISSLQTGQTPKVCPLSE